MTPTPLYLAVCPACFDESEPDPDCWRCHGRMIYSVDDVADADLILQLGLGTLSDGINLGVSMEPTPRFTAWLREIGAA